MNAIDLLNQQHDEVEALFAKAQTATRGLTKEKLFIQIADALAIHAAIEEKIFYPALKANCTGDILLEAVEEHLAIKRVLADLLDIEPSDNTFGAKLKVLQEEVEHHVNEERTELFPKVTRLMTEVQLEALGQEMEDMAADLDGTEAREEIREEISEAAPIQ